jgi:carboxyl-terminal processing protease
MPSARLVRRSGFALAALLVTVGATAARQRATPEELLAQVMTLVRDRFAASDAPDVYAAAARGLVRELGDPYSQLLSPKEVEDFSRSTLGRYAGVGMEVVPVGDSFYVGEVFPGGPSEGAGLKRGDRVLRIDGTPVDGLRVVARLRGVPDSPVAVDYDRSGTHAAPVTLRRAGIRVPAVPYLVVERGIAYIPLPGVSGSAGPDVEAALARAASAGARGVVLDLRGNPGGAVDQAVRVVSALLPPDKPVLEIRERTGSLVLRSERLAHRIDLPLVVLQDQGSASAAEIITGALQDHDRALVVGQTSYGKGLAQSLFPLEGGYALKLTTAKWYTPVGRSIHRDRTAGDSARHADLPSSVATGVPNVPAGAARFRSLGAPTRSSAPSASSPSASRATATARRAPSCASRTISRSASTRRSRSRRRGARRCARS